MDRKAQHPHQHNPGGIMHDQILVGLIVAVPLLHSEGSAHKNLDEY